MEIIQLTSSMCTEFKWQIANYIYLSMNRGCAEEWFSRDDSLAKTDQLKQFIDENKAYSFVALEKLETKKYAEKPTTRYSGQETNLRQYNAPQPEANEFSDSLGGGVKRKLCGFLWAYPYGNENTIYLSIIYVDEKHREDGIGKMLIKTLETRVKTDGFTKIWLHTDADNFISRRFYSKMGYKETRVQLSKEI